MMDVRIGESVENKNVNVDKPKQNLKQMSLTPKEKAEELVELYRSHADELNEGTTLYYDKECALIAAKLILQQFTEIYNDLISLGVVEHPIEETANYKYWQEVKQEIENLRH